MKNFNLKSFLFGVTIISLVFISFGNKTTQPVNEPGTYQMEVFKSLPNEKNIVYDIFVMDTRTGSVVKRYLRYSHYVSRWEYEESVVHVK